MAPAPLIIAGPCSAETEEQTLLTAKQLAAEGVTVFRAGLWKPRTRPGCFEGVGAAGLRWLKRVKRETGMAVATEVATPAHVRAAFKAGIDLLWIGARTTANPFAVQEIADAIAEEMARTGHHPAVLVKNPVSPDLDLWIGGLQRIYNAGVRKLGAVHRGFGTYGKSLYRNPPHWQIPIELHRLYPELPLLFDPSHTGGKRELVAPLSRQALNMGFDGLMIESHFDPDAAWSDSAQQLTPAALAPLLRTLPASTSERTPVPTPGRTPGAHFSRSAPSDANPSDATALLEKCPPEELSALRAEIDAIDDQLIELIAARMRVSDRIGDYKRRHGMAAVQIARHDEVMRLRRKQAEACGLDPDFTARLLREIHAESVKRQLDILDHAEPVQF